MKHPVYRSSQIVFEVNKEEGLDEAEAVAEDEDDEEEVTHVQVGEDLL